MGIGFSNIALFTAHPPTPTGGKIHRSDRRGYLSSAVPILSRYSDELVHTEYILVSWVVSCRSIRNVRFPDVSLLKFTLRMNKIRLAT